MTLDPRTPVIVGVGQYVHHAASPDDGAEPVVLMAEAVRAACCDAGLSGVPTRVDSIRVVNLFSWRYSNPGMVLARRLGIEVVETAYTTAGGHSPQALTNRTALDIAAGRADLVILTGGEAWRTRMRMTRAGTRVDWATASHGEPPLIIGEELEMSHPDEMGRGIALPVQVYPLFESAYRATTGAAPDEHLARIADLWSRFSAVAVDNPHAWSRVARTPSEILDVTPQNRIVGLPYRKVMNANNDVDMAAALVLCSAERAAAMGIAADRWVFPHAGTDCRDHPYVSHRWSLSESPAIRIGGQRALGLAGIGTDDTALVDLYSCFPSAVHVGAAALGLPLERQLTRTGGLSFAGGPWNNYAMHAIATIVTELRDRPAERALIWANGGFLTKHSFGVYAATPPSAGFRHDCPQREIDELPARSLATGDDVAADFVKIEAYTVMYDRDGIPDRALAACRLPNGHRAWGSTSEPGITAALTAGEWVGRSVRIDRTGILHV